MKSTDIIVGQTYGHIDFEGVTYLGIDTAPKSLVIINTPDGGGIGIVVKKVRQIHNPDFWDGFYSVSK